jgi:hypothetical protein
MDKMNVITFRSTSHVLGAVVRTSQADKPITIDDVAANGIVVRGGDASSLRALVDASQLQVAVVDYDTRLFYRPLLFAIDDGRAEQQDESPVTVTLDGTTVTVELDDPTPSDIEVYVHVTGGALTEPAVRAVPVLKTTDTGSVGLVLGNGDYTVLAFAPDYATTIDEQSVP